MRIHTNEHANLGPAPFYVPSFGFIFSLRSLCTGKLVSEAGPNPKQSKNLKANKSVTILVMATRRKASLGGGRLEELVIVTQVSMVRGRLVDPRGNRALQGGVVVHYSLSLFTG